MQIVCPNCNTSYEVNAAVFGSEGRSVRCARCKQVWFAQAFDPDAVEPAKAPALAAAEADFEPAHTTEPPADDPGADWGDTAADAEAAEESADPSQIDGAPPLVPAQPSEHADDPALPEGIVSDEEFYRLRQARRSSTEDIESFAARRAAREALRRKSKWPLSPAQTAAAVLLAIAIVLVGWRSSIVRLLPQTASFYSAVGLEVNLRGLVFRDIKITREQHEGVSVLAIEGIIASVVSQPVEVPRLRFAVRNEAGNEIYAWTALPTRPMLQPGETLPFRSRLASPPPEARTVLVRFFNKRDMVAGTH